MLPSLREPPSAAPPGGWWALGGWFGVLGSCGGRPDPLAVFLPALGHSSELIAVRNHLRRLLSLLPLLLLGLALEALVPRHLRAAAPASPASRTRASAPAPDRLGGLVVLAYHEIADPERAALPDYAVRPADFASQLEWLAGHGYHFVSVDQVLAASAGRQALPAHPVLLSFDDGYRSVWTGACARTWICWCGPASGACCPSCSSPCSA